MEEFDVAIVGAGFGGLGAAVALADSGARVVLLEQLRYAGGCASTFVRGGARYESGATLFSGFGEGQLFRKWIDELELDARFEAHDPLVTLRTPNFSFAAAPERATFIERIVALEGVPAKQTRAFFAEQEAIANVLWGLFNAPELLPPFSARMVLSHLRRLPLYLPVLRYVGKPLRAVLERHGLSGVEPLEAYLNAVCQITVQCGIDEVEAPFALGAMDYYFRGTGHVHGGIGEFAGAVVEALAKRGVDVRYSTAVKSLNPEGNAWRLHTRRGELRARNVVANLTPHALQRLRGFEANDVPKRLRALNERVEGGWGA
ncbi:MAG: FAD-dependent oxidoreductase, partial [Myxococcota bacterium]